MGSLLVSPSIDSGSSAVLAPDAIVVRLAHPDELPALGDLCARSYIAGSGMGPDDDYAEVLRDAPGRAHVCEVLAAKRGGQLVGTVTICGGDYVEIAQADEVEFRFLAVAPEWWGAGVGQALVDAVVAWAGDRPVVCSVIRRNDPAHALYARLGFDRVPERDWTPVPGVDLLVYRRA